MTEVTHGRYLATGVLPTDPSDPDSASGQYGRQIDLEEIIDRLTQTALEEDLRGFQKAFDEIQDILE